MSARGRQTGVVQAGFLLSPIGRNGLIEKILELTFQVNTNCGTVSDESRTPTS